MKNKKGFTLVELLATIAILGILATIAGISVSKILGKSKSDISEIQEKMIIEAAKAYAAEAENSGCRKNGCTVAISTLISEGYLEDGNEIDKTNTVNIIKNGNKYFYDILNENSLKYKILGKNNVNVKTTSPNFTSSSTDTGLFVQKDDNSKSINGQPTYYYRGNVNNNYVKFAGFTWRIVRINEDGSIRLIGQNGIDNNKVYKYSMDEDNDGIIDDYYYGNSNAKQQLDRWYNSNLSNYSNIIVQNASFCNYYGINNSFDDFPNWNSIAKFTCPKNLIISDKIGLITADEAIFAGAHSNNSSIKNYLYNGYQSYTMTSYYVENYEDKIYGEGIFYLIANGTSPFVIDDYFNLEYTFRPVINLKSNITVSRGNGTSSSPYVIQ